MKLLILLALVAVAAAGSQKRYDGYKLYQVTPKDKDSFDALVHLFEESSNYDFWTEPRGLDQPIDIMVPPAFIEVFTDLMEVYQMGYTVKMVDVQSVIEMHRSDQALPGQPRTGRYAVTWDRYYNYDAITTFLTEIQAAHPNLVTLENIGQSYEGRAMWMAKISTGGTGKKAIVIDGGIHAREWISPAFTTWLINELVENYAQHPQYVDNVDWYIMPVINPDGYEYSHTTERLWRKNRKPVSARCFGVDMNRNFGFHWNEGGSSGVECQETFHGGAAFSEIESQNVRDAILRVSANAEVYLTFHSYGLYFLHPWGYTATLPADEPALRALGEAATNALAAVYGTRYSVGSSTVVLYVASGGSDDWAKGVANIPFSYTVEMRDEGAFGFQLPAAQIIPNNLEVWEAVKVMAESLFASTA